jgi:hypothetical protein
MKYQALPIATGVAAVLGLAGLAGSLLIGCSNGGNHVQVVSAVYGEYTNFVDVTFRVKDLLQINTGFAVQPSYLQVDPFPYYHKALVIVYLANGRRHIFTAYENDTVSPQILLQAARN